MKANLEKLENNLATLKIEVDREQFEEAIEKSYRKNVKKFNIPGFRKGKAPRKIIEVHYGEEVFYEDAINYILPEAYAKAVEETGIEPVSQPNFDIVKLEKGEPFVFVAEVTVKPEVELGQYTGLEVAQTVYEVTEESVEHELEKMRQNNARLIVVDDKPIKEGDVVTLDFEGLIAGKPFKGGKTNDYILEVGSNTFIPGFEEQLIGLERGAEKKIQVTLPEDYAVKDLAGKQVEFKVKIKEIKEKKVPVLDDDFAKDVSEFETLQELKEDVKNRLIKRREELQRAQLENDLIEKVVEKAKVDIPDVMVENRINSMINDFSMRLRYRGLSLDRYLEMNNLDMDTLKNKFRDDAYDSVKTSLVLEAIIKKEDIQAEDEEVEEEIKKMAENYNQSVEGIKKMLKEDQIEQIKEKIIYQKTIDFLIKNSKIVTKKVGSGEQEKEEEKKEAENSEKLE